MSKTGTIEVSKGSNLVQKGVETLKGLPTSLQEIPLYEYFHPSKALVSVLKGMGLVSILRIFPYHI